MRDNFALVDDVLVLLEPVEVCAPSMLTLVSIVDAPSYLVSFLPTLNGLGAWRVGKVN